MAEKKTKKETQAKQPKTSAHKKGKAEKTAAAPQLKIKARLAEIYKKEIAPELMKKFGYKSVMQVPRLHKIVVNMGVGDAVADPKMLEEAMKEL